MANEVQETKKCKHCQSDIPKKAKVCPVCKKKQGGGVLKWVIIAVVVLGIIGAASSGGESDSNSDNTKETQNTKETTKENTKENTVEDFSDGLKEFESGDYLYITNEDLDKYAPNLSGVKIYTVISVNDIKNNKIQSTLTDGFMMSNFDVGNRYDTYKKLFKRDDVVAILGTVSDYTDYKITNKSVSVENCYVFAAGSEAESYNNSKSDDGLSKYFVVTGEVADTNSDISEEEYKNLCEQLNYEDILRNPDSNKNKYCVISGKVDQIIEGWFGSYTIYITDSDGNKWECYYSYKDGESHLLEGDSVTVYGKCNGTTTSTTVMGKQVTLPDIRLQYIK